MSIRKRLSSYLFNRLFSERTFRKVFRERLQGRNGGGRDRITPDDYLLRHENEFKTIPEKCRKGIFTFSSYNERLIMKGRGKFPRVISVPTVRDRLVLAILNKYLQLTLSKKDWSRSANERVRSVQNFKVRSSGRSTEYIKTDFKAFYDNIDREVLIEILSKKGIDRRAFRLIEEAINTPTKSGGKDEIGELPDYGVPQGLAISNILSDIYLKEFDEYASSLSEGYIRYVDDILFLCPKYKNTIERLEEFIKSKRLNLSFHPDKTVSGILGMDKLDFLGYEFKDDLTSVRRSNVTSFFNRLAKECVNFKRQYKNKGLRAAYLYDDGVFMDTRIALLNLSLTGIKVQGKYYGWMHHYQQIDDVGLLSMIDRKLCNSFLSFLPKEKRVMVKSLKRIYYVILSGRVDKEVFDYDNLTTPADQRAYLTKLGKLDPEIGYEDKEIRQMYIQHRDRMRKKMEAHIGKKS